MHFTLTKSLYREIWTGCNLERPHWSHLFGVVERRNFALLVTQRHLTQQILIVLQKYELSSLCPDHLHGFFCMAFFFPSFPFLVKASIFVKEFFLSIQFLSPLMHALANEIGYPSHLSLRSLLTIFFFDLREMVNCIAWLSLLICSLLDPSHLVDWAVIGIFSFYVIFKF